MKISLQKFKEAVELLKKKRIANKSDVSVALGYNNQNAFTELLGGRSKLNLDILSRFCEVYNFKIQDFIEEDEEVKAPTVVAESGIEYPIDTIKTRISEIESQFDVIIKGQDSLSQMLLSGVAFMDSQTANIKLLKKLVGA